MPPNKVIIRGDGNCLFRAVSFVVHGTQEQYHDLRALTVTHVRNYPDNFQGFFDLGNNLDTWAARLSRDMEFGDHVCVKALAQVVSRPILVWRQSVLNTDLPRSAKVYVFVPDGYSNEESIHLLLQETALAPQGACGFGDFVGHYNVLQAASSPASAAAASEFPDVSVSEGKRLSEDIAASQVKRSRGAKFVLTSDHRAEVLQMIEEGAKQKDIALKFGVSQQAIAKIKKQGQTISEQKSKAAAKLRADGFTPRQIATKLEVDERTIRNMQVSGDWNERERKAIKEEEAQNLRRAYEALPEEACTDAVLCFYLRQSRPAPHADSNPPQPARLITERDLLARLPDPRRMRVHRVREDGNCQFRAGGLGPRGPRRRR